MFAGTERGGRIHRNPDRSGRHNAPMMRTVNKKSADPHGRKRQLIFHQPIVSRQLLFLEIGESSVRGGCGERELPCELGRQKRRLPIGLYPPLLGCGLKYRYGICAVVEEAKHGIRRVSAAHLHEQTPGRIHGECPSPRPTPRE